MSIAKFLNTIWKKGEVREIRAMETGDTKRITAGWFDDPDKAAPIIEQLDRSGKYQAIYLTMQVCHSGLLARCANKVKNFAKTTTSDKDIISLQYLLIDCDPKRPAGISSSAAELSAAKAVHEKIVSDLGSPLVSGMSGNGFHAIYKHDGSDPKQIQEFLQKLAQKYDTDAVKIDTTVYNPSRITKVLGTMTRKGENIPDRPWRKSVMLAANNGSSAIIHLPKEKTQKTQNTTPTPEKQKFDARKFLAENNIQIKREKPGPGDAITGIIEGGCLFDSSHTEGEAAIIFHPSGMATYQCFHDSCRQKTWEDVRNLVGKQKTKPVCHFCKREISWQKIYGRWVPFENDTPHRCIQAIPVVEEDNDPVDAVPKGKTIELPLDKIHPVFAKYWEKFAGQTETSKEYVLATLLASMGAMIGNKAMLKADRGFRPNMYIMLIGGSTFMRKTTGMDYGMRVLRDISEEKKNIYEKRLTIYDEEIEQYEKKPRKFRQNSDKPNRPTDDSNIYSDELTPEMLLRKMADKSDGVFSYSEAGSLLARLSNSYMAGFKERLTDFFDGRSCTYRRETVSGGCITVKDAAPSLVACSTFQWLQQHLNESDLMSGFLGRFLFVVRRDYPETKVPLPPFFEVEEEWYRLFRELDNFDYAMKLTPKAQESYSAWYKKFWDWSVKQDELAHSFLGRLMTYCHKIAIVNHAISYCQGDKSVKPDLITEKSYEQAYAWIEFFAQNILDCYSELVAGPDLKETKIIEIIRTKGKNNRISHTWLSRFAHMKAKDLNEYMQTLEEKRYVKRSKEGKYLFWEIGQEINDLKNR